LCIFLGYATYKLQWNIFDIIENRKIKSNLSP